MTNIDPGYYWYVLCVKCRKEIVLKEANDPDEEAFPKAQSQRVACPNCGTEHTYRPSEMQLGEVDSE